MNNAEELRHYSDQAFDLDRSRTYEQTVNGKPHGFWVSILGEDDWASWCISEDFADIPGSVEYAIQFTPDSRILRLSAAEELDDLTRKFGADLLPNDRSDYIDWAKATEGWDGIIIAPYMWDRRLDLMWYYGWDCASGCIWNLDVIESMTEVVKEAPHG